MIKTLKFGPLLM